MKGETLPNKPKLLDELRTALRMRHYSYRTEQCYGGWARRYIRFHNKKHPNTTGASEVRSFCSYLAGTEHVSASTQNQAFNASVFLYRHVVKQEPGVVDTVRVNRPGRLPVVLSRTGVQRMLSFLSGTQSIMDILLHGSGLRLMECHRLRVKAIEIEQRQIVVRDGKGFKDRVSVLPEAVIPDLKKHLESTKALHQIFTERDEGSPKMPGVIPCVTALLHIRLNRARTYERCRNCSGIARAQGRENNNDLYPCHEQAGSPRREPG